ncbi:MAG: hypothetical protein HQK89_10665, partial [Nitrospirae bacterium]|nr:hypothetical protein [Nitrospirota bacterium]
MEMGVLIITLGECATLSLGINIYLLLRSKRLMSNIKNRQKMNENDMEQEVFKLRDQYRADFTPDITIGKYDSGNELEEYLDKEINEIQNDVDNIGLKMLSENDL